MKTKTFIVMCVVAGVAFAQEQERISTFTDERDGQTYRAVLMPDGKTWMAQNLNFETESGSWCYDNDVDNCEIYGRLYDWATAMNIDTSYNNSRWSGSDVNHQGICPDGWRLPSNEEWQALVNAVGGDSIAGTKLKSEMGWKAADTILVRVCGIFESRIRDNIPGTNDYGFSALPSGRFNSFNSRFLSVGGFGSWWTATSNLYAREWSMYFHDEKVYLGWGSKIYGGAVRCIRGD